MDMDISEQELLAALMTCTDSAPGADGIPYSVYKKLWSSVGKFLLDSWNQSYESGIMPPSHSESIIVFLPKEGKDVSEIKNWKPIMLFNCDAKIIKKALAMRMISLQGMEGVGV